MTDQPMTSLERVLTTLSHKEPDRTPLFLLLSMSGAKFAKLGIRDYFHNPDAMVEAQLAMRERYANDCLYGFFYAALEAEAFGGSTLFYDDGPPNTGVPPLASPAAIDRLTPPQLGQERGLGRVIEVLSKLKAAVGDDAPIIGVVTAPFSLPVMQLGFERYLKWMYEERRRFERLMEINSEFCVTWANAQLDAGATVICYINPVSSVTMVPRAFYLERGYALDHAVLARIRGPVAIHTASGRALPLIDDYAATGAAALGVSAEESVTELKARASAKLTLLGNLNGVAMRRWTPAEAERQVKRAIRQGAAGGGFILADNHGEIPWQVADETLLAISRTVREWGRYPLDWSDETDV